MNKYKIAEIAVELDDDGSPTFWCYNAGYHPEQGGMSFCWGNFGTNDIEKSLDLLKARLTRDIDEIVERIKDRVEKEKGEV